MPPEPPHAKPVTDIFLLTWTAGVLDALSYLQAHVFTANMTGNTVVLGLALAGVDRPRALESAVAVAAFAAGVFLGAKVLLRLQAADSQRDLRTGTSLEAPFALAFAALWILFPGTSPSWAAPLLVAAGACALGIQSVAARQLQISGVATTFITGTITTAVVSFVGRHTPTPRPAHEKKTSPLLLGSLLGVYVLAAMAGASLALVLRPLAPLAALGPLAAVLIRSLQAGPASGG